MKRILFIIISILSISIKAQVGFIYIKYSSSDGVSHKFPILKIDGEKCIKNKNETKPNWDEYYPFFVNVNGELFDADQVKYGWYDGDNFLLMDGWVVLDNKKSYYTHKEMIYSKNEIAWRTCNGQKWWFVLKPDGTYLQQVQNKMTKVREDGKIKIILVGLSMNKKNAVALFNTFKMIFDDTNPCGFGSEDDRGEFLNNK